MKKFLLSLVLLVFLSPQAFAQDKAFEYTIDTITSEQTPLVGQQIVYEIIISESEDLQYSQISFEEEAIENWDIVELKTPIAEQTEVDGKKIRQVKFSYAIFPQKSGEIKLPSAQIVAYKIIKDNEMIQNMRNSRFAFLQNDSDFLENMMGMMGRKISTTIKTPEKTIKILPIIENENSKWWLPAKNVEIGSSWDIELSNVEINQPLKRTITILAIGVTDVQIPNLEMKSFDDLKIYPEKPTFSFLIKDDDIVSRSMTSVVYISKKSGEITIPKEVIYWYNTKTKNFEEAVLPEEKLYFKGDVIEEKKEIIEQEKTTISQEPTSKKDINIWLIIASFLSGIFITYIILKPKKRYEKRLENIKNIPFDVIKIAKKKDFKMLEKAMIFWGKEKFLNKNIMSLQDIKKYIKDENMQNQIDVLSKKIYSFDDVFFDEKVFIKAFEEVNKNHKISKSKTEVLPKLYK